MIIRFIPRVISDRLGIWMNFVKDIHGSRIVARIGNRRFWFPRCPWQD